MALCTTTMTPKHKPIQAVVCFCHGYTDTVSYMKQIEYQRLVDEGIAFVAIEYEGHGRSDGSLGLINDWNSLIEDVSSFFQEISRTRFAGKSIFLMGESMGGAVAYCTYNRIPNTFRGVVFVCPMCKISDDMLPPQWVVNTLIWLIGPSGSTSFLGYLPIAPAKRNVGEVANKLEEKRIVNGRAPLNYERNPRLATARELIKATQSISSSLSDFDASFLVIHGKDDRVTDPKLSQSLYEESKSKDKSLRLYDGMWHGLTSTEPDENINLVFSDAITWILQRS
jgi:acylglycerol lipase